jgi:hypothetical protein
VYPLCHAMYYYVIIIYNLFNGVNAASLGRAPDPTALVDALSLHTCYSLPRSIPQWLQTIDSSSRLQWVLCLAELRGLGLAPATSGVIMTKYSFYHMLTIYRLLKPKPGFASLKSPNKFIHHDFTLAG